MVAQFNYERNWATYFGDENVIVLDSDIDSDGNLYIAGKIRFVDTISLFQFATSGAHQTGYGGGSYDGFIAKFSPQGQLVWGTYFGGENYDAIESIVSDKNNALYITGTTQSTTQIATLNVPQTALSNTTDVFISKFNTNGQVIWSTYLGGNGNNGRYYSQGIFYTYCGLTLDDADYFYLYHPTESTNLGTPGTFQPTKSNSNYLISKFNRNGTRIWSTYYGINASAINDIALTSTGVVVGGRNIDCPPAYTPNTYFSTPGCHQPTSSGCNDSYISKFSFDGNRLWSTYYGGTGSEWLYSTSGRLRSNNDYIYYSSWTNSNNNITTPGAFQETKGTYSHFLVKFNDNGVRLWGTYIGNNQHNGVFYNQMTTFLTFDNLGNPIISGSTLSDSNIATTGSYQDTISSTSSDSFICKFSPEGLRTWGTYYGGVQDDYFGETHWFNNSFYLVGSTKNTQNISTIGSYQSNYIVNGVPDQTSTNTYIAKFSPTSLSTTTFENGGFRLYPNPSNGRFSVAFQNNANTPFEVTVYDALGKTMFSEKNTVKTQFAMNGLAKGLYFVAIKRDGASSVQKMIVE